MKIDFVCVSARTLDTEPSFFISVDGVLYLFNVPDGTQRLFMQHKWKLNRIKQIFFTSHGQEALGGILGAFMTTTEGNPPNFGVTLTETAEDVLRNTLTFTVFKDSLPVLSRSFEDEFMSVSSIPLTQSLAFLIKLCDYPGKFMPDKAKSLGIPPGPLFKQLQSGQSVTLPDGKTIDPTQVKAPATPGDLILVLDCKSPDDFEIIKSIDISHVSFFIHLTSPSILTSKAYLELFPFNSNVKHWCFMESGRVSYDKAFEVYKSITGVSLCAYGDTPAPDHFENLCRGASYCFVPAGKRQLRSDLKCVEVSEPVYENPLPKTDSFAVTILGTGAKLPSKLRNPTAILVHLRGGFILVDVGEDCLGQLRRKYGVANTEFILKNLKLIWISHYHGDHLFGSPQLLEARARLTDEVIPFVCDGRIIEEMQARDRNMGVNGYKVSFVDRSQREFEGDGFVLKSFGVVHCEGAQGCLIVIDGKYKLAFSGDRSCTDDEFVTSISECDVLIHEATFSDDLLDKANEVGHSTIAGAIATGKRFNAKFTILTHISNRYSETSFQVTDDNLLFAFDHLHFTFESLSEDCEKYKETANSIQNKDSEE